MALFGWSAAAAAPEQAAPGAEPSPWTERLTPGGEFAGRIDAGDPSIAMGTARLQVKCALLPTEGDVPYEVVLRKAADNPYKNIFVTGPAFEVGTGTCAEFKRSLSGWIDPSLPPPRLRFVSGGGDYVVRVWSQKKQGAELDSFRVAFRRLDSAERLRRLPPAQEGVVLNAGGPAADRSAAGVEQARTAYLQMCGKGVEKLSAATCDSMRRDLDAAAAAQAASAREAEVMSVHRQLCAPGSRKLSADTCAAMLAEAKRTLAAGPERPASPMPRPASDPVPVKSAYEELCAPGAQQVSAETCATLKADAAARPATARPAARKSRGK